MIIRTVQPSDIRFMTEIYTHYVINTTVTFDIVPPTVDEMAERIKKIHSRYPCLVALDDTGNLMGYAYAHLWKERAAYARTWETTIYLAEGKTGGGIGSELMRRLISACKESGCHSLIACITADNAESIRFHEALGFKKASHFREVGFKFGRFLDVIDMELIGLSGK